MHLGCSFSGEVHLAHMHAIHGVVIRLADLVILACASARKPAAIAAASALDNSVTDVLASIAFKVPIAREAESARTILLRKVSKPQVEQTCAR